MSALNHKPLPEGWRWERLGNVIAEAQMGFASGERDPKGVIQLRMNNIDTSGNMIWEEFIRVPADEETQVRYRLQTGDVLFNNTNSTELVGKTALFTAHEEPVVYSNHFTRLRPNVQRLDSSYLASWLVFQWQNKVFERICNRWIGQSAIKSDKLLALEIHLPPLAEQRRIAAILREQMAAIDRARAAAEAQVAAVKALFGAYVRSAYQQANAEAVTKEPLDEIAGITAQQVDPTLPDFRDLLHINGENIESGTGKLTNLNSASEDGMTSAKYLFDEGDVLYSKLRPYLGKVAIAPSIGLCSADMYPIKVNSERLNAKFLMWMLLSDDFTQYAVSQSQRARMPKLNRDQLFRWKVPLPSLLSQRRIVQSLNYRVSLAQQIASSARLQLDDINALPAAVLRRAFNGEL